MPVAVTWDDEIPHVMRYSFTNPWTWEEFRQATLIDHEWGEALAPKRYDIIADLTGVGLPKGTSISNVSRQFEQGPSNRYTIYIVGSALASALIPVAGRLNPRTRGRFIAAKTLAEARQGILAMRQSTSA